MTVSVSGRCGTSRHADLDEDIAEMACDRLFADPQVLCNGAIGSTGRQQTQDFRLASPRFQGSNLDANLALVERLRAIAGEIGATPAQIAIAWVAAQGNDIVPLVGARRRDRLTEAIGALDVKLTPSHLAALANAFPPDAAAGTRYTAEQMAHLDSEKR